MEHSEISKFSFTKLTLVYNKVRSIGHRVRIKLNKNDPFVKLANHYPARGESTIFC